MNVIDIICIVCLIVFIVLGFVRGFIPELFKLLKWVFSVVGAKLLASPIALLLFNILKIEEKLRGKITGIVDGLEFGSLEGVRTSLESGLSKLPFVGNFIGDSFTNNWGLTELYQSGINEMQTKLIDLIMGEITPTIISLLESVSFVGIVIILSIILSFIFKQVVRFTQYSKIVGSADKVLGCFMGGVKGVVICIVLLVVMYLIASVTSSNYLATLEGSKIFGVVYSLFLK